MSIKHIKPQGRKNKERLPTVIKKGLQEALLQKRVSRVWPIVPQLSRRKVQYSCSNLSFALGKNNGKTAISSMCAERTGMDKKDVMIASAETAKMESIAKR